MPRAYKQKNGKWRCQLYLGDKIVDGKRRQVIKSFTASTKAEAEDMASEYRRQHGRVSVSDLTVRDAMRRYIDSKSNILSETTLRAYESQLNHYYDGIDTIRARDLTIADVQTWINDFGTMHSKSTCRKAVSFLNSSLLMFECGFDVARIRIKAEPKRDIYVPTADEVWSLYHATPKADIKKAILLAAFGSLRRGEICALTLEDVNFKKYQIRVTKDMVQTRTGEWIIKEMPKTDASVRTVTVPHFVIEELTDGLVLMEPDQITSHFQKLTRRVCGASYGIHSLRHFFASYLHYNGIPQRTIERMGGWKPGSPVLARIYQGQIEDKEREQERLAVEAFEGIKKGGSQIC